MPTVLRYSALVLALSLLHAPLRAQWSDSSHVNTALAPSAFDQMDARIVSDGAGGVIVTWREFRPSTGYDIRAGRLDTMGYAVWPAGGVAVCTTLNDVFDLRVASDGRGGAVIAWREARGATGLDVYAQRIDSNGAELWPHGGVAACLAAGDQDQLQIAGDGLGGVLLSWRDPRGADKDIYAQRIDSTGSAAWAADGAVVCATGEDQDHPQIASDGGGGAIIAWEDRRSSTNEDVYAQRIASTGLAAWVAHGIAVYAGPGDQVNPRIASDQAGRAVIAWEDARSGTSWDVYAQRVNPSGILMWAAPGEAVCTAAQSQGSIDIADDGSGGALIAWQDDRNVLSTDIYAQRLTSVGGIAWTPGGVAVCDAPNHQFSPRVVSAGAGSAVVAWHDLRNGTDYNVYAQRIGASGSAGWTADGVALGAAAGHQLDPVPASDGAGGAIVAWKDGRNGSINGIFAQNVLAGGTLGRLPWVLATSGPNGSVSPAGITAVERGGGLTVTMTPATGFHVDSVFVNGAYVGAPPAYEFQDVNGDSTLHAVFAINVYTVTAFAGPHGAISQPGATSVVHGQTQAYSITPDPGYDVGLLQIDGAQVPETTYYIFTNITGDRSISAWFVDDSSALASIAPRWNIVSAPLVAADFTTTALYPSAVTGAFLFDGAYQAAPVMENGLGYWLKFDSAEVVALEGAPLHVDTVDVIEGWNMVGSISVEIPAGSVESIPPGVVTSQFFAYSAGYTPVSSIRPARGYWVKVSEAGRLVFSASPSASPANRIRIEATGELPPPPPDGVDAAGEPPRDETGNRPPGAGTPAEFRLEPNYPNPFNPSTAIRFSLPAATAVVLEVFSTTGERVARLLAADLPAGLHSVGWDATGVAGGIYFCRLTAAGRSATRKLVLLK